MNDLKTPMIRARICALEATLAELRQELLAPDVPPPARPARKKVRTRESDIEQDFRKWVEARGGESLKFVSPGTKGVPDRLVFLNGILTLIEFKAPGKKPEPLQVFWNTWFNTNGFVARIFDDYDEAVAFIKDRHGI